MNTQPVQPNTSKLFTLLLLVEAVVLAATTLAFWHPSPPIRDNWVWLLWFTVPVFGIRLMVYGERWYADYQKHRTNQGDMRAWWMNRLRRISPLVPLFAAFILITLYNYTAAPMHRDNYIVLVCRPLLGMWTVLHCIEQVRVFRHMRWLIAATITAGLIAGWVALTATQWNDKSAPLNFLINVLPHLTDSYKAALPEMLLSFNPNEVAGALAWLCPLLAGCMLYPGQTLAARAIRWSGAISFAIMFLAMFLGQSRFAFAGVVVALAALAWLCIPNRVVRYTALAAIGAITLIQVGLTLNILPLKTDSTAEVDTSASVALSGRDQESLSNRTLIWSSAIHMMLDYPLTGVGMSMFRSAVRNPPYVIPFYAERNDAPPHAHNEWLQVGADLGFPGLVIFVGIQLVTLWMLWQAWRNSDRMCRLLAVAIAGALFAHAVYGAGDAVTLWDRYSFVFWWVAGMAAAVYTLSRPES